MVEQSSKATSSRAKSDSQRNASAAQLPKTEGSKVRPGGDGYVNESGISADGKQQKSYQQLESENRQLRVELGQACYKINRLNKLREQAAESQRKELLARQNEARALKELDLAKEHVNKRETHARNEKAEHLKQIKFLEESLAAFESRENNISDELAEATIYRQEASQHVEEAQKLTEKWKAEAISQSEKVKVMENKLKQMEDKRQQDKQRLRELASLVRAKPDKDACSGNTGGLTSASEGFSSPVKLVSGKRPSSRGPHNGKNAEKPIFEDPIKPIKGEDSTEVLTGDSSSVSAGLHRRLSGFWCGTLRPMLFRDDCILELESEYSNSGAPGRGKGKKGPRASGGAAALTREVSGSPEEVRQRMVLGALVIIIMGLAVTKLTSA